MELLINEPFPDCFYWVVFGPVVPGKERAVIAQCDGPVPTRQEAADAGVAALLWHGDPNRKAHPVDFAQTINVSRNKEFVRRDTSFADL